MDWQWCEIDTDALSNNIRTFRRLVGPDVLLSPTVKSNAYGHDAVITGKAFLAGGADWLCVHALEEARRLRQAGVAAPLYVMGPVALSDLEEAVALDVRMVAYNFETIDRLEALNLPMKLHLKIETGNHRQGLELPELLALARRIKRCPKLEIEGLASHFANIEDTTHHQYARQQLDLFEKALSALRAEGFAVPVPHLSNSAAALLWPERVFRMARLGIAAYGLWPSPETQVAAVLRDRGDLQLCPALTWKTRIAQVREVPAGAFVGYGLSYMTTHKTRLAILPVGYADGYDRGLSNLGHVLIAGQRAPIRGRVCMNLTIVDVTDIPEAKLEDEAVLLGRQGDLCITAEQLAGWASTIHYEMIARIREGIPRYAMPGSAGEPLSADAMYREIK